MKDKLIKYFFNLFETYTVPKNTSFNDVI